MGKILKTTNGGQTWSTLSTGTYYSFTSVFFVNSNVGFAVGDYWNEIVKTTDGGASWTAQSDDQDEGLWGISFTDASHGIIVGSQGVLKTVDGG